AHYLGGGGPLNKGTLETSCKHSSLQERRAADAERASIRYKQSEFLLQRIGQTFDGLITGVTSWGIYVELKENKCEGMISIRDLRGDAFKFIEGKFQVVGMRTGKTYRLGDELRVTIRAVDMEKRVVDLVPEGSKQEPVSTAPYRKELRGGKRGRR
ncbi:MAG: S1 RNA-binding domain-containing protein, partial [Flavobacteriales bacterium]